MALAAEEFGGSKNSSDLKKRHSPRMKQALVDSENSARAAFRKDAHGGLVVLQAKSRVGLW